MAQQLDEAPGSGRERAPLAGAEREAERARGEPATPLPVVEPDGPGRGDAANAALPILDEGVADRPGWRPPRHEGKVRWAVLLFACLLFLPHLGSFGLWDPWETHYGAVTTEMIETYDWLDLWWGYKEKIGSEGPQGSAFFSKPIFTFWSEALAVSFLGRGEWAIRLPMALLAIASVFVVYLTIARLWSRRTGLLAAGVLATSPQFFLISRQAQTDMPFVGTMVLALCCFLLAVFGPRRELSTRGFWWRIGGTAAFVLLNTIPQYVLIATDLNEPVPGDAGGLAGLLDAAWASGAAHAAVEGVLLTGLLLWFALALRRDLRAEGLTEAVKDRWLRRAALALFYVLIAQSTYAKGLLGFMLPGLFIFVYLLWSGRWALLKRAELLRGGFLCLLVGLPWYLSMFSMHGWAYYQRFFIHDHFNRLASGVHQIDSGTFEHFIKWLGFGMFPWSAFVPLAIGWLAVSHRFASPRPRDHATLFLGIWFACAFSLFTLSSTQFHHYIFPALPALAILTALFLRRIVRDRGWLARLTALLALLFLAGLARDIHSDPQSLRNLMTYKYDRPMPEHLPTDPEAPVADGSDTTWAESSFWEHTSGSLQAILTTPAFRYEIWIPIIAAAGLLAIALMLPDRTRRAGLVALGLVATLLTTWSLNYYMPMLSPHWSQKYLFDTYYDQCSRLPNPPAVRQAYTPILARLGLPGVARFLHWDNKHVCREDIISWRITWRGETYYSFNELQPISNVQAQFPAYLEERNGADPFYALTQRGRMPNFKSELEKYTRKLRRQGKADWKQVQRWNVRVVHDASHYFQLLRADPVEGGASD